MKKITALSIFVITLFTFKASAQESIIGEINYGTLEKYIQSAKENYPRRKVYEVNVEKAKANVSMSHLSYLDILNVSYFYRPDQNTVVTTPGSVNANPYSVNGFQFGATLNIGTFLQKPAMAKRAKLDLNIAKLENEEYDTTLANEVKRRYYNYIRLLSDLKIKTQTSQDYKTLVDNLARNFEKGEIQLEAYSSSRIRSSEANSSRVQSEADFLVARDALEEIIGKKLTDIK